MKNFLTALIVLILTMFLVLWKFDVVSSIFPGWNTMLNTDNLFYLIVIVLNIIIPIVLYFGFQRTANLYVFFLYFIIVNAIFIAGEFLVYDSITPGLAAQNFEDYLLTLRFLTFGYLLIHLIFYIYLYRRLTRCKQHII
jgi:hypothetical protein